MHHFSTIAIPAKAWRGHGYCAGSETWFTLHLERRLPGEHVFNPELNNKEGAFHPNKLGHEQSFRYTRADGLRQALQEARLHRRTARLTGARCD